MIRKYALVPFLLATTAIIAYASAIEAKRAQARARLDEIVKASKSVARTEKRAMKMFDQKETTFDVTFDGTGLCKARFPRRDWGRDRDRDEGWDPREGNREPREQHPRPPSPARTSAPGDLDLHPALACDSYEVLEGEKTTIADRAAESVVLEPRVRDRGAIRIWADVETHVPLRLESRMVGATEWRTIYEVQSVVFGPVEKLTGGSVPEKVEPAVVPQWLPAGFQHVATTKMTWRWGGRGRDEKREEPKEARPAPEPVYESKYSDGVTSIRIVVSTKERWWPKKDKAPPQGTVPVARHKMGPFAEYGLKVGNLYVTVMGTLSEESMQRIVGSLAAPSGR